MKVRTDYGEYNVTIKTSKYLYNKTLRIQLLEPKEGPFAVITVNIEASNHLASDSRAFVDTNNCPWAENFIKDNKLGVFTGLYGESGYCSYPLYEFDLYRLGQYQ